MIVIILSFQYSDYEFRIPSLKRHAWTFPAPGLVVVLSLPTAYQRDVCLEAPLNVLPVELDAPGAHPQVNQGRGDELGERPTQSRSQDLER